nr:T9SS type A sorting domain-containing protein [candidate division Zixibacteria bacterium]
MNKVLFYSTLLLLFLLMASQSYALVYLNRRLIECEPLTYVVEPIELIGEGMTISRDTHNEYGDCVGDSPGPPFIIEMPIMISNEYNDDGSVLNYGSFTINNSYIKADDGDKNPDEAFVLVFQSGGLSGTVAISNDGGLLTCKGKAGDPIIFGGCYRIASSSDYSGELEDYSNTFLHCNFTGRDDICTGGTTALDFLGGNTTFENCNFKYFDGGENYCLFYQGNKDLSIKNCLFSSSHFYNKAPIEILGVRALELESIHFNSIGIVEPSLNPGLIYCPASAIINRSIKNISASNCRLPFLRFGHLYVYDSAYIQSDIPILNSGGTNIDSGGVLVIDKGTVFQMYDNTISGTIKCDYGRLIVDSAVLTGINDRDYGYQMSNSGYKYPTWYGIYASDSGSVNIKNSRLRLAQKPINIEGPLFIDSCIFENNVGYAINIVAQNGREQIIQNSYISGCDYGNGITYQISREDETPQRFTVSNMDIVNCSGLGLNIDDNMYHPKPIDIFIENCKFGSAPVTIELMPLLDTLSIKGCYIAASSGAALALGDKNGDSSTILLESNIFAGGGESVNQIFVHVRTGKMDFINNSILFCKGFGLYNSSTVDYTEKVYNNLFAHNGNSGYKQVSDNGDQLVAYNNFYDNDIDGDEDVYLPTPTGTIYTFEELIGLGGIAATNKNYDPVFIPADTGVISFINYDSIKAISALSVQNFNLKGRSYKDRLIRPNIYDTVWYFILDNTDDTLYVAGQVRDVATSFDTFLVVDPHLSFTSPLVDSGYNDIVTSAYDFERDERIIDADENGTASVDIGGDEYKAGTVGGNGAIIVFAPREDSLFRPGETVDITWLAQEVDYVHIMYALDYNGYVSSDWHEIELMFDPDSGHCQWEVPDTISYRCRILVQDAAHSDIFGESGVFHIKPRVLTRVLPDSTYERFRITEDNWQFANTIANMWPFSWYTQFDYTVLDVYTGENFPAYFIHPPIDAYSSDFPNWGLFVGTFGTDQCYMYIDGKYLYRQRALEYWMNIKGSWGGSCYGLSNSAMMAFGDSAVFKNQYPAVGAFTDLYPVTMNDDRRVTINRFMVSQFGKERITHATTAQSTPLPTLIRQLSDILGNNKSLGDLNTLTICDLDHPDQNRRGCHNVVPYKLEKHISDPDKFWIYVYDCNIPTDSTTRILADTALNFWTYDSLNWDSYMKIWVEQPLSSFLNRPTIPGIEGGDKNKASTDFYLFYSQADSLRLESPDLGHYYTLADSVDDSLINGMPLIFNDKLGAPPYGFYLPNGEWDCRLTGAQGGLARISLMSDKGFMTYYRLGIALDESERIVYPGDDSTLWIMNGTDIERTFGVRMCYYEDGGEYLMQCQDIETSANDSSCFKFIHQFGFLIENHGSASDYILKLNKLDTLYNLEFVDSTAHIDGHTAHYIYPEWSKDYINEIKIYIDTDIDGSIDDSLIVSNDILLDVNDDSGGLLPATFNISQNYPNPFNPQTNIEYSLPTRSQVNIDIYNILGQKVRTLVDKSQPAGEYRIIWDSNDDSGIKVSTGIYFYRFQAGEYVETKKMLLIK